MPFQINSTTPPDDAQPAGIGTAEIRYAPIVQRNQATARTGTGAPCGIDDELFAIIGRPRINTTGLAWYYNFVGSNPSASVTVQLFDTVTQTWITYNATMWAPQYTPTGYAGTRISEFTVRFSNLVPV